MLVVRKSAYSNGVLCSMGGLTAPDPKRTADQDRQMVAARAAFERTCVFFGRCHWADDRRNE